MTTKLRKINPMVFMLISFPEFSQSKHSLNLPENGRFYLKDFNFRKHFFEINTCVYAKGLKIERVAPV